MLLAVLCILIGIIFVGAPTMLFMFLMFTPIWLPVLLVFAVCEYSGHYGKPHVRYHGADDPDPLI